MKIKFNADPLACESCGDEAIGEHDLYLGEQPTSPKPAGDLDVYAADDPILSDPKFFPATALCSLCLMLKVPTVPGPWHSVPVGGQS